MANDSDLPIVNIVNSLDLCGAETKLVRLCGATAAFGVADESVTLRGADALRVALLVGHGTGTLRRRIFVDPRLAPITLRLNGATTVAYPSALGSGA